MSVYYVNVYMCIQWINYIYRCILLLTTVHKKLIVLNVINNKLKLYLAMVTFTIAIVVFLGNLIFTASCQAELVYESESITNDGRTVLLGGLFAMHNTNNGTFPCGDLDNDSVQRVESMVHTINSINEDIELLPNITLAFSIRDTCSDPTYGLDQAFKFVQTSNSILTCSSTEDNVAVSGVVGAEFSGVSISVANLLRLYKTPQISYISTADILGDKSRFDYFFRTIPPDSLQARAIADIIVLFNWTFIFMLYSDDAYGNGGIDAVIEHLHFLNQTMVCIAARIPLSLTATSQEYNKVIAKMSQDNVRNASVAVLFGHPEAAEGIMEALRVAQMKGDYSLSNLTWIGTDSWVELLPDEYHSVARGLLSISPRAIRDPTFDNYFVSLNPEDSSTSVWFDELWELTYECSLSKDVLCGQVSESIIINITEFQQARYITLVSDAVYSFAHAIHNLVESRCPNSTLCEDILENRQLGITINGELLREQLYNISFQGQSANIISFDQNGEEMGAFFIKNLQHSPTLMDKFSFVIVGTWDDTLSLNFTSDIEWATGDIPRSVCSEPCEVGHQQIPVAESQCCWTCSPCQSEKGFSDGLSACQDCNESFMPDPLKSMCIPIPVSYLTFSNAWSVVLLTFTIVGLIATASIIIVFLVFYQHKVVKASSREHSAILLLGLVLCYIMPFFFVLMPSPAVCALRRIGVGVSFAVCFSALLIKTNLIYRIFNLKSMNSTKPLSFTSISSQVNLVLFFISIQVFLAVIWLIIEHPSTTIVYGTKSAELRCEESPLAYLGVSLGYNFILLLFSTYYAFLSRKVPENFNEVKYINITLYTLCIIWLAFIPTYFATLQFGAIFQATTLMIAIILSATTTLACIFMPKVILLISTRNKERDDEGIIKNDTISNIIVTPCKIEFSSI